jgi:hypothetical protein
VHPHRYNPSQIETSPEVLNVTLFSLLEFGGGMGVGGWVQKSVPLQDFTFEGGGAKWLSRTINQWLILPFLGYTIESDRRFVSMQRQHK